MFCLFILAAFFHTYTFIVTHLLYQALKTEKKHNKGESKVINIIMHLNSNSSLLSVLTKTNKISICVCADVV